MRNTNKRTRFGDMARLLLSTLVAFGTVLSLSEGLPSDVASAAVESGTWYDITYGLPYNANGIAVDSHGDLFVTANGNQVEELPSGATSWKNLNDGHSFVSAGGIAVDAAGDLFVVDQGNPGVNYVEKLPAGTSTWQSLTHGYSFNQPDAIAVDSTTGNVYVSSYANIVYELPGSSTSWQDITDSFAFASPVGVAVDSKDNVYVVDNTGNGNPNTVDELPSGSNTWSNITDGGAFKLGNGIAVDNTGNVFVTNYYNNTFNAVEELPDGTTTWQNIPLNGFAGKFAGAAGIAVDSSGDLFVANSTAGTSYKVMEYVPQAAPSAPTNLSVSTTTTTSTTLLWSAVSGAQSYNVYENGGSAPIVTGLTGTSYTVTGLTPGQQYSFTVSAVNSAGPSTPSNAVTVRTSVPPFSAENTWAWNGQYGVPYNPLQLQAAWGPSPYTWSLNSGTLPRGLTLSTDGLISGTPTGPDGTSTFSVQVKDANGQTAYLTLSITISGAPTLSVSTSSVSPASVGKPYTAQLQGVGAEPLQWSLVQGSLPRGLSLGSDGIISGTPTMTGEYSFTVQASDASGTSVEQALTLSVAKPPRGERVITYQNYSEVVPAFVQNKTTYMPIWYVMQALKQAGVVSRWDGRNWRMTIQGQMNLTNLPTGSGDKDIFLNGTLVRKVDMTTAIDPATGNKTTYIPIWYAIYVLERAGLQSTWDGTTWTLIK